MAIEQYTINIGNIPVEVVRKDIINLHIGVYPPNGRVRVAAPLRFTDEAIRLAVVSRIGWIRRKQKSFDCQIRQSKREMVSGESHYYLGHRYRLDVIEENVPRSVRIINSKTIELHVRPGDDRDKRESVILDWYRQRLREQIPALIAKWEPIVGVKVEDVRIKKMKTRWGTFTSKAKRIWLNLELVKKPEFCLEYVLVHEMVHFHERYHNDRFLSLMDEYIPKWRLYRDELNRAPLAEEEWNY